VRLSFQLFAAGVTIVACSSAADDGVEPAIGPADGCAGEACVDAGIDAAAVMDAGADSRSPQQDAGGGAMAAIVAGGGHACYLDASGLRCWGRNDDGQLGAEDTENRGDQPGEMGSSLKLVDLGPGVGVARVFARNRFTCALLSDARVKCWGNNESGQLGLGDTRSRGRAPGDMGASLPFVDLGPGRTAKSLALGFFHACAILDNDSVKCWGNNESGQLGYGDVEARGDAPSEMGANLPAVDLGPGRAARAITAGFHHTCAILDDATVKCWGYGGLGQLGLGDATSRGDGPDEMGSNLPAVDLGTGVTPKAISAGIYFTCVIASNDAVKCWGKNTSGQLGLGDMTWRGDGPNEMGDNLSFADLGPGRTVKQVSAGDFHVCAVLDDDELKCWGWGFHGQLDTGASDNWGDAPNEMGTALPIIDLGQGRKAKHVSSGSEFVCAMRDDGSAKCWGRNTFGELGLGDVETRGDGPGEKVATLPTLDVRR